MNNTDPRRDRRYGTKRWQQTAKGVLARDLYRCWVSDCTNPGSVADHIKPVYVGMPDAEFYGTWNLRASCRRHNWARGVAARLERETVAATVGDVRPRWPAVRWGR